MITGWQAGHWDTTAWQSGFWVDTTSIPTYRVPAVRRYRPVRTAARVPSRVATGTRETLSIRAEVQPRRARYLAIGVRRVAQRNTTRIVHAKSNVIRRVSTMGTAVKVPDLDMDESAQIEFDFTDELGVATIASAIVTVDLRDGADPDPSLLAQGARVLVPGGKLVTQLVKGRNAKCSYAVRCVATGSDGLVRTAVALIRVVRL